MKDGANKALAGSKGDKTKQMRSLRKKVFSM
jgi:hypothetical protein